MISAVQGRFVFSELETGTRKQEANIFLFVS